MTTAIILIALVSWFTVSPLIAVTFGQMIRSADVREVEAEAWPDSTN